MKVEMFVNGKQVDRLTYEQQVKMITKAFKAINYEPKQVKNK